jgi:hypothetical protein
VTDATYVPDGDPCPKHGLPSRLMFAAGIGLFSQCQGCIDAFLDWFGSHTRDVQRSSFPIEKHDHPQPDMPAWRARQFQKSAEKEEPVQFDLGVSV